MIPVNPHLGIDQSHNHAKVQDSSEDYIFGGLFCLGTGPVRFGPFGGNIGPVPLAGGLYMTARC